MLEQAEQQRCAVIVRDGLFAALNADPEGGGGGSKTISLYMNMKRQREGPTSCRRERRARDSADNVTDLARESCDRKVETWVGR